MKKDHIELLLQQARALGRQDHTINSLNNELRAMQEEIVGLRSADLESWPCHEVRVLHPSCPHAKS